MTESTDTVEMSSVEYSRLVKKNGGRCSPQNVSQVLNRGGKLKGVVSHKKVLVYWRLDVDMSAFESR